MKEIIIAFIVAVVLLGSPLIVFNTGFGGMHHWGWVIALSLVVQAMIDILTYKDKRP